MEKLFVPYEFAVMAKEKGFNEKCICHWYTMDVESPKLTETIWYKNGMVGYEDEDRPAPLYQQLVDWFREEKHILINITQGVNLDRNFKFNYSVYQYGDWYTDERRYYDYRQALRMAIHQAFKLI